MDNPEKEISLIRNTGNSMKEYLLYLPIYSELTSLKIGVEEGHVLEGIDPPFRHRVVIYGSSFTQGISTSRAGMSYPDQFTRHTGIQMLPLAPISVMSHTTTRKKPTTTTACSPSAPVSASA